MSRGIRRYGPGKFNTILDSYIYAMIGEGMGEESAGDVSEVGFAAESILLGPDSLKEVERIAAEDKDTLTPEEVDLIKESHGAIMVENEQGFVSVDYYDTKKEYEKDWAELEEDASGEDEDEEDDEEENGEEGEEEEDEEGDEEGVEEEEEVE